MDWLANKNPPWVAYQEFMSGCLITLDNQPGLRLVCIGETRRHIFAKCVLKFMGSEATHVLRDEQIYTGFQAGINRALHRVQSICKDNLTKEKGVLTCWRKKRV